MSYNGKRCQRHWHQIDKEVQAMSKTMRWVLNALATAITAGLLMSSAPSAFAQQRLQHRVVVIEQVPVIDPFFPYPYPYPPNYVARNYGYVKVNAHHRSAAIYVDGGYADRIEKTKQFALRPGTHEIELRDSDGRTFFQERVAVIVG